ncbi:response regulator transcription factor [Amycolatopsis sp.]|uniref:response regulator transcription factor n=1 Tax=Amycolatopsis sp. TaxID=37632 RepID=UPI002DF8A7DC|nr:response regulator transcription factor [Amycolatopsis sp.]
MTVKVVLLDDEELVRSGIRLILEAGGGAEVVAEDVDGGKIVELVAEYRPDVVLTDIQMPAVNGLEVTRRVTALPDAPPVVVLTTFDLDEYVYAALRAGASGFLLKDIPPRELVQAVQTVARGDAMLSPRITKRLISSFADTAPRSAAADRLTVLTEREREVALTVAEGLSNAEISKRLHLSESTVKAHLGRVMAKLDLPNRTRIAILVHDAGLA